MSDRATTAADFEIITLCVTKRCMDQLRFVSLQTGRQVESLAEAALEDAGIQSEREYKPVTAAVTGSSDWVQLAGD